jgi:hypothetical protein
LHRRGFSQAIGNLPAFVLKGVNFINVKRANFLYERRFGSFFLVTYVETRRSYEKFVCLTLMKLTKGRLAYVLPALIERTKITCLETEKWAEGRRDTVKAVNSIVKTFGVIKGHKGKS